MNGLCCLCGLVVGKSSSWVVGVCSVRVRAETTHTKRRRRRIGAIEWVGHCESVLLLLLLLL